MVKIWDYQNKTCVQTLEGHAQNISSVSFHPELPIILTGSEDGTVKIWHANTYRLENTLNYGLERVWDIGCLRGSNNVALGYDEGAILIKLGREEPAMSMDSGGKIIWAKHSELQQASLKALEKEEIQDGERLPPARLSGQSTASCSRPVSRLSRRRRFRTVKGFHRQDYLGKAQRAAAGQSQGSREGGDSGRRKASTGSEGHGQLRGVPADGAAQPQREVR